MLTIYTVEDRTKHLTDLLESLEKLCKFLKKTGQFPEALNIYMSGINKVKKLLDASFSQADLSELSRAIPDLFSRHRDWVPPFEHVENGVKEPEWFQQLEKRLQPVLENAKRLREIGYY